MAIHDTGLQIEPLVTRASRDPLEHDGRDVGRENLRAEARGGDTESTTARRHVQEPHTRTEAEAAQAFVRQPHVRRRDELVVARGDVVPGVSYFTRSVHRFLCRRGHDLLLVCVRGVVPRGDATTEARGSASGEPPISRQAAAWVVSPKARGRTGQMSLCS